MSTDALLQDISQRLQSLGESVSEERIRGLVSGYLDGLMKDESFQRKMRFGGSPAPKLIGSKYARWGLTAADVEWLHDVQDSLRGQRKVGGGGVYAGPSEELRNAFKAVSDAYYLPMEEVRKIDQRALDDVFPRLPLSVFYGADRALAQRGAWDQTQAYRDAVRAMDTAESGYGNQLIGAQYVGDLWEGARPDMRVFSLFDTFEMTAPTAYLPVEADLPEMLYVAENTANNSSNYDTSKTGSNRATVTAKKFVIHQMWSGEMEEDSIIPFVPFLRRQAQLSLAFYSDSAILNGDTTDPNGINTVDTNPANTKHFLAFDGLRHGALVDNTANSASAGAGISLALLNAQRGRMIDTTYKMDWGHPSVPEDLVYVVDPFTGDKIALLDEVITMDKFGPQATVLTGQVTRILGHPVIGSIAMEKATANGYVDADTAGNNTTGQSVCVNRRGAKIGWRRRVQLESERLPATDQTRIVYSLRMGLGRYSPTGAASGIEWVDELYNITL